MKAYERLLNYVKVPTPSNEKSGTHPIRRALAEEMAFFNNFVDKGLLDRLENVVNNDFARVTYTEAIKILSKHNDKFEFSARKVGPNV